MLHERAFSNAQVGHGLASCRTLGALVNAHIVCLCQLGQDLRLVAYSVLSNFETAYIGCQHRQGLASCRTFRALWSWTTKCHVV